LIAHTHSHGNIFINILNHKDHFTAEKSLDCLGEACPIPLVKAQKEMERMAVNDVLIVNVDHSCAMKNLPDWARSAGHAVEIEEVGEGEWDIIIQKLK